MNLYLVFIVALSLIGIKIFFKGFNKDYISKKTTTSIKGIFVLLVFYSHLYTYIKYQPAKDFWMFSIRNYLGQLMVAMFLLYSGFGIGYSLIHKGEKYLKKIPVNRILKTLFNFDIAVLTFLIVNCILKIKYPLSSNILAFTAWGGIGNSNWYIFAILVLYFISYLSFTLFDGKDKKNAIICSWVLTIFAMFSIASFRGPGFDYCYNTMLCYTLGFNYAFYHEKVEEKIFNNKIYWLVMPVILIFHLAFNRFQYDNSIMYAINSLLFSALIILISMKIDVSNKVLNWLGEHVFWIYILQRLPMIVLSNLGYQNHSYRFALIAFVTTMIIAAIYKFIFDRVNKKIFE